MHEDTREQERAAEDVNEQVAIARTRRALRSALPNQKERRDRHELPEQEQGRPVSREHHAERGARVDESGYMLPGAVVMERIQDADESHEREDQREDEAQRIDMEERERVAGNGEVPAGCKVERFPADERGDGAGREHDSSCGPTHERHDNRGQEEYEPGMYHRCDVVPVMPVILVAVVIAILALHELVPDPFRAKDDEAAAEKPVDEIESGKLVPNK